MDYTCNFDRPAQDGKYCPFKIETLENCSPGKTEGKYGFPQKKPCVFLKLNKVKLLQFHSFPLIIALTLHLMLCFLKLFNAKKSYF